MSIKPIETARLRITLHHRAGARSGLSEIEAWGDARLPVAPVAMPTGNLAHNPRVSSGGLKSEFPKASASHTSRYDRVDCAIDGIVNFQPAPHNRWTSYESKSESDWLEIDFGRAVTFRRVELAIYDDRGGVQAPSSYTIQAWTNGMWRDVERILRLPEQPVGGQWNEARFDPVTASKVRITFTHRGPSRSGVSEVMVWND